ncbi:hypothetical protein ACWPMX_07730 [Tsuneonella sp. HG094]
MNGNQVIDGLQLLSGTLWLSVMLSRLPSVLRIVRDRDPSIADFFAAFLVGNGAVQLGFVLRWWLYPNVKGLMQPGELVLWGCLYLVSSMLAGASHWLPRNG